MTLKVEDGTGLEFAASYVPVSYLQTFAEANGLTISDDDEVLEAKLREATEYADTFRRYKGQRSKQAQEREFPRVGLTDWSGLPVEGVPKRLKDAVCYLAVAAHDGPLFADLDRGGKIKSESVGPISTTFADDAPAGRSYVRAERLLEPFVREPTEVRPQLGYAEPASGSIFSVGMHDYPGTTDAISEE